MYSLENIRDQIKIPLLHMKAVQSVDIYRNRLVVIDIKTEQLAIALDITNTMDVFLVCRTEQSRRILSDQLNIRLGNRTQIADKSGSIVEFISIESFDILAPAFCGIISQLISHERDLSYLLRQTVTHLGDIAKDQQLTTQRETFLSMGDYYRGKFLSIPDTLRKIKKERRSIARFGDGEIKCMVTASGCRFQNHNWGLMYELREIASHKSDLLVCFPGLMPEDRFWQNYWPEFWPRCQFYLNQDVVGDSMITRPEAFYAYGAMAKNLWMELWEDENVCFITGKNSRMNGNHEIFSNIKSTDYLYCKNNDAYDDIDMILDRCLNHKNKGVYLIALGPTGTALASRLQKAGKWALDIGHLNNSYDTVFHNAARPEKISYPRSV